MHKFRRYLHLTLLAIAFALSAYGLMRTFPLTILWTDVFSLWGGGLFTGLAVHGWLRGDWRDPAVKAPATTPKSGA